MKITYEEESNDFGTPSIKIAPENYAQAFELGRLSEKMDSEYRKEAVPFGDPYIRIKLPTATPEEIKSAIDGVLSMGGLEHPDGGYSLCDTGHFKTLKELREKL